MKSTRTAPGAMPEWLAAATLVGAIKLAWIALDPVLRVFLGDSASYLHSALVDAPPSDRSFVYALLLRWLALPAPDLEPMLWWQSGFGAMTALLAFGTLRTWLGVRLPLALAAAALLALEPAQVLFERMIMAESAGTLCFAVGIACGVGYLRTRALRFLAYGAVAGVGVASLRLNLLPVVLGMALLPPLVLFALSVLQRARAAGLARAVAGLVVAVLATGLAHAGYQRWFDLRSELLEHPGYSARDGAMRLALVAPLVKPEHLARQALDPGLLAQVGPPLADPEARERQMWLDDGLVAVITRAVEPGAEHHERSERVMRKIATRALREDPAGFLALSRSVAAGYFDPPTASHRMAEDLGRRGPNAEERAWLAREFGYVAGDIAERHTAATRWFESARWWLTACLFGLVPLALVAAWLQRRDPAPGLYFALLAAGMVAGHLLFSAIVSYRYLHAFPVVAIVLLAWLAEAVAARRGAPG